ncbi:MAG: hypothetical protein HYV02_02405 [Deltaproteobacteria bacterium]|nr:hypothetical protein [Deltaproteobacteria bacterium]
MNFSGIKPDVIKYEVRQLSGESIHETQQKKRGGFGRFLSGLGRVVGAIAAPLSFLFPPAGLIAASAYAGSNVGDFLQQKAMRKMMEERQGEDQNLGQIYIPGLTETSMDLTRETVKVFDPMQSQQTDRVVDLLLARNASDMAVAQAMTS